MIATRLKELIWEHLDNLLVLLLDFQGMMMSGRGGDDDNEDCILNRCASICAIESNSISDTRKFVAYWVFYSLISLFEHAFMKLLEWPLFSLGYPLCASICAIESNSNSDTRKLIVYWVFYSLISLFEHAFMKLLEWLLFWPHMKLMIMYWLMIPHFSGALYFYELLVQPCVSLVPQIVINLFNEWKEPCLKRDDFPTEAAERYQKQNESEASEELISSDESIEDNVGQKEDKDVEVTEENEDVEVTKENEDVEVTEKNEVAAIERVTPIESTLVQTGKSTETLTDMNVTSKSTPGYTEVPRKISLVQEERNMIIHRQKKCASSNELKEEVNKKKCDVHGLQINSKKSFQDTRSPLVCYICNVWCPSKDNLDAHLKEKKHLARIQELADFVEVTEENEDVEVTEKNEVAAIESVTPTESTLVQTGKSTETLTDMNVTSKSTPGYIEVPRKSSLVQEERNMIIHRQRKCASNNGLKEEVNIKQCDVHGLQINSKKIVQDTQSPLLCYICNVWCPNKDSLDAHLKGKKHSAQIQELTDFVKGQHA